ncbi:MAG: AI-2E family transporter [Natronospirillum sp.]|uniref:AI-2E family transporter n=1 Tax=Natronospirillum sp. TaxID=2812955 RepID=UPI0025F8C7ED|nr:AI-2E family transporter [Natronospirillum sp.]MCH8550846.1 AI-2E family transporter [Natronospirillum sp.]
MSVNPEDRLFGTVERRLFRVTVIMFVMVAFAALIGLVVWILALTLSYFFNLIVPLAVAGILALILYPLVDVLGKWSGWPRMIATVIVVTIFMGLIAGAGLLLVPTLYGQTANFIEAAPGVIEGWDGYLSRRFPGLTEMLKARVEDGTLADMLPSAENTREAVMSYAGLLVTLSFVPLLLFFMLLSGGRLREKTEEALSVASKAVQKRVMYFIDVFVSQVTGFFQGQLVIALIMAIMLSVGFTMIGLKGGILVGLVLGLLNIVPFLGTLIGLLVVLPWAYFQPDGGLLLLGLSLSVFLVVQLVESWLLTPKIMANRSGLHPALIVISVIFWGIALGGIIGMILAVPLTAFFIAVWKQAKPGLSRTMEPASSSPEINVGYRTEETQGKK